MQRLFTEPGAWSGGSYQMKLFLGPPSDSHIQQALDAIWTSPPLNGPYGSRDTEPWEQQRIQTTLGLEGHLYGTAKIRQDSEIPCGTFAILERDANDTRVADFVSLYVPLSALGPLFPVGAYPFGDHSASVSWRPQVDEWFLGVLEDVRGQFRFEVGVIGWEPELTGGSIEEAKAAATAVDRFDGIFLSTTDGIVWHPPTRFDVISLAK